MRVQSLPDLSRPVIIRVSGSSVLSLARVDLSSSVALNVFEPVVIFILPSAESLAIWALAEGLPVQCESREQDGE